MNAHLLVLEIVVPDENQLHATSHWQTCITFCSYILALKKPSSACCSTGMTIVSLSTCSITGLTSTNNYSLPKYFYVSAVLSVTNICMCNPSTKSEFHKTLHACLMQSALLITSPMPKSSKNQFGLVKICIKIGQTNRRSSINQTFE